MKFMSKILNYRIVLQPAVSAVTLAGGQMIAPSKPGIYVKFEDGLLSVEDEQIISLLKNHVDCNNEFWPLDSEQAAVLAISRPAGSGREPEHNQINIEYGHVGKNMNPKPAINLTPETKKFIAESAAKMAQDMLHSMMESGKLVYKEDAVNAEPSVSKQPVINNMPKSPLITAPAPEEDETNTPIVSDSEPEPGIELKPKAPNKLFRPGTKKPTATA